MPKDRTISVLYDTFDIIKSVPSTYDEGDKLVGEIGGLLDGWLSDCIARNFLRRLYRDVSAKLVEKGWPRAVIKTEKRAGKDDINIYESHIVHIGRIHDESKETEFKAYIGKLLQETATTIPLYEAGDRQSTGGRINQGSIDAANEFFAQGDEQVEKTATLIEAMVPGYKIGRDEQLAVTPETLARGIQALEKHIEKEAKSKAKAALTA